ncbi:NAD(P)-dependent oxidoreductase [Streptomyces sp. NPDC001407]|uniref:NAD(P)-dependent oxidoreductase n=1 Tax=Streptomyces sp. NPDC001407 TaxID=3364573 RepID=UPI0036A2799D
MSTIVVIRGAADIPLIAGRLPGAEVHESPTLDATDPHLAGTADVLVLRSGQRLDAARLARWPALRHVIRAGSGLDGIDTTALQEQGVSVHRNPHSSAGAVAEWALAAFLALARRIPYGHAALAHGEHTKTACLAPPPSTLRLAIWGGGPIGHACAGALAPYVADITYAARASLPAHYRQLPPGELTGWADVHLVALPLNGQTHGMFGPAFLDAVRPRRPHLICVGRMDTLDVPACLRALAADELAGLAIDPIDAHDPPLPTGGRPMNLLLTPHIGAQRTDVRTVLDSWVADTVRDLLTPAKDTDP